MAHPSRVRFRIPPPRLCGSAREIRMIRREISPHKYRGPRLHRQGSRSEPLSSTRDRAPNRHRTRHRSSESRLLGGPGSSLRRWTFGVRFETCALELSAIGGPAAAGSLSEFPRFPYARHERATAHARNQADRYRGLSLWHGVVRRRRQANWSAARRSPE